MVDSSAWAEVEGWVGNDAGFGCAFVSATGCAIWELCETSGSHEKSKFRSKFGFKNFGLGTCVSGAWGSTGWFDLRSEVLVVTVERSAFDCAIPRVSVTILKKLDFSKFFGNLENFLVKSFFGLRRCGVGW